MVGEKLTVTVEEPGELLGISRWLAYELVRRGDLPSLTPKVLALFRTVDVPGKKSS